MKNVQPNNKFNSIKFE